MLSGQNEETELEKLNARAIVSPPARPVYWRHIYQWHPGVSLQLPTHGARHSSKYLAWSAYTPQNNLHGAHMELGIQNSSAQFELAL